MKRATKERRIDQTPTLMARGMAAALLALFGCAEPEKEKLPRITTQGAHAVAVGATIQIVPATTDGMDRGYTFASAHPDIASVNATGQVTGRTPGETTITVTGADTKASGSHPVVVLPPGTTLPDGGTPDGATGGIPPGEVPFYQAWLGSAHADRTAEAFAHWNDEGNVPATCARCHSSEGFVDYLGGDGSVPGKVDQPAPPQSVIRCVTCHAPAAEALTSVTFPSGAKVEGLGREAVCMTCHQGRASGADIDKAIQASGAASADQASPMLSFTNIHYYPAAATLYAGRARGGYQYPDHVYDTRFRHVEGFDKCTGCHDPHSARVKVDACSGCHAGVRDLEGLRAVRMLSSYGRDYDGDGDIAEGIYHELAGLREKLVSAISRYGIEKGTPVCYAGATHPYWFIDGNRDGTCSAEEAVSAQGFKSWTPRLLRAAYNYQMATKDPGAFAHNAKYIMELLYDAITDLNAVLVVKIDMAKAVRGDRGHFDGSGEAARHWDEDDAVDASCSRCHSGKTGFRFFVEHGVTIEVPETANGLECGTCHTSFGDRFDVLPVMTTRFPGGATLAQPGFDNLCSNCHSGRIAKADIDAAIAEGKPRFLNIHYLPAAGVRQGNAAAVGYEYAGKTYSGPLKHMGGVQCTSCHDPVATRHTFMIEDAWDMRCKNCHADANGRPENIRQVRLADYDGDGSVTEPLPAEVAGLAEKVLLAMRSAVGPNGPCYQEATYPYFFRDSDGDGKPFCAATEAVSTNTFRAWTPALMKAAHNFQLSRKDPGAWAHNFDYVAQLLHDSIEDLGGNVSALTRP